MFRMRTRMLFLFHSWRLYSVRFAFACVHTTYHCFLFSSLTHRTLYNLSSLRPRRNETKRFSTTFFLWYRFFSIEIHSSEFGLFGNHHAEERKSITQKTNTCCKAFHSSRWQVSSHEGIFMFTDVSKNARKNIYLWSDKFTTVDNSSCFTSLSLEFFPSLSLFVSNDWYHLLQWDCSSSCSDRKYPFFFSSHLRGK